MTNLVILGVGLLICVAMIFVLSPVIPDTLTQIVGSNSTTAKVTSSTLSSFVTFFPIVIVGGVIVSIIAGVYSYVSYDVVEPITAYISDSGVCRYCGLGEKDVSEEFDYFTHTDGLTHCRWCGALWYANIEEY